MNTGWTSLAADHLSFLLVKTWNKIFSQVGKSSQCLLSLVYCQVKRQVCPLSSLVSYMFGLVSGISGLLSSISRSKLSFLWPKKYCVGSGLPGSMNIDTNAVLKTYIVWGVVYLDLGTLIPIQFSKHFMAAPTAVSSWYTFTPLSEQ